MTNGITYASIARCSSDLFAGTSIATICVVSRALSAALSVAALFACDGSLREKTAPTVDGGALTQIEPPPCDQAVAATSDGYHHPGEDCLMCHYQGGEGPPFTFGGTLFADSGGTAPVVGATFHLIDALGTDVMVPTQTNGNFWSVDLVTFPVVAFASLCPDVKPMLAPLAEGEGSCNRAGCHTSGFRMHVP